MSGLKEIKTRIGSVKNTLKITSAMKMVASAKLHKAQAAIGNKLPYEQQLRRILSGLLQSEDLREALKDEFRLGGNSPVALQDVNVDDYPSKADVQRVALVAFSSNSSLCGAFNANAVKKFNEVLDALRRRGYSDEDIDVYAVGRKMADAARKAGLALKRDCCDMADKPSYDKASDLANQLIDSFTEGDVSQVILLYNHFASTASQPTVRENYLPLAFRDFGATTTHRPADSASYHPDTPVRHPDTPTRHSGTPARHSETSARHSGLDPESPLKVFPIDYTLEPDPLTLVKELLPKVLLLKMYTVLLDANAAEHAARTMAMQIATDNAQDLIAELTLAYNKGRQQEITAEILDLIGGTMA